LIVRRDGKGARVFTRRGFDWTGRFPWIEDALRSLRVQSATLYGEAVVCGHDGVSDFEKLHSRSYDHQVFLYAFDLLELNGDDFRGQPLEKRKAALEKLLAGLTGVRLSRKTGNAPAIKSSSSAGPPVSLAVMNQRTIAKQKPVRAGGRSTVSKKRRPPT
jgi:ATP-dependent DNA ligase